MAKIFLLIKLNYIKNFFLYIQNIKKKYIKNICNISFPFSKYDFNYILTNNLRILLLLLLNILIILKKELFKFEFSKILKIF